MAFGFALLKLSITVPNAPVVSLPMHHVTSPEALAWVAFSASGAPPFSLSSLPQPAIASATIATNTAMNRGVFIREFPPPRARSIGRYPLSAGNTPMGSTQTCA